MNFFCKNKQTALLYVYLREGNTNINRVRFRISSHQLATRNSLTRKLENLKSSKIASWVRISRKIHRKVALPAFICFFIIAFTGLLLGWKKHTGGALLPDTQRGISSDPSIWLPVDSLQGLAIKTLNDSVAGSLSPEISRIDIRPPKGIAKFVFKDHYWEIQLDCTTGKPLQVARRNSDLIERIHDGSIIDNWLNIKGSPFKLAYTSLAGLSLLSFIITGIFLYFGAKWVKRSKDR